MSTLVLRVVSRLLTPIIAVLAVYLFLRGHNAPGGGFIAGLVAAAAMVLRYLADGPDAVRRSLPLPPQVVLAAGLGIVVGFGLVGLLVGGTFLDSAVWTWAVLGAQVKLAASLVFDLGVLLVVLGAVVSFLGALGRDEG